MTACFIISCKLLVCLGNSDTQRIFHDSVSLKCGILGRHWLRIVHARLGESDDCQIKGGGGGEDYTTIKVFAQVEAPPNRRWSHFEAGGIAGSQASKQWVLNKCRVPVAVQQISSITKESDQSATMKRVLVHCSYLRAWFFQCFWAVQIVIKSKDTVSSEVCSVILLVVVT